MFHDWKETGSELKENLLRKMEKENASQQLTCREAQPPSVNDINYSNS